MKTRLGKCVPSMAFDISRFKIVHEPVDTKAAAKAVQMVRDKEADFIMKGLVSTDKYMRYLEQGLRFVAPESHVVSRCCDGVSELPQVVGVQ